MALALQEVIGGLARVRVQALALILPGEACLVICCHANLVGCHGCCSSAQTCSAADQPYPLLAASCITCMRMLPRDGDDPKEDSVQSCKQLHYEEQPNPNANLSPANSCTMCKQLYYEEQPNPNLSPANSCAVCKQLYYEEQPNPNLRPANSCTMRSTKGYARSAQSTDQFAVCKRCNESSRHKSYIGKS